MRWLMLVLFVSVAALLIASTGLAYHIWREHRKRPARPVVAERSEEIDVEIEEAP